MARAVRLEHCLITTGSAFFHIMTQSTSALEDHNLAVSHLVLVPTYKCYSAIDMEQRPSWNAYESSLW